MNTYFLPEEKLEFYNQNGFFVIKKLFDTSTLNNLRQRFTELCNGSQREDITFIKEYSLVGKKLNPEDYINKVQDILHDEVFMTYSENPKLLHIVSQLLGEDLTALNSTLINKPPGTSRHPPHQDLYYLPVRPANIIAYWTAIDPATIENGCLFCIPGTHKMPLLDHGAFQDCKSFFHVIKDEEKNAPVEKRVYIEMNPGDTVFLHPLLIHGSGPNVSK
ncbi:Phytanoyl-CoA dioxygenase peroxisomal, partial [Operophtera brumata]